MATKKATIDRWLWPNVFKNQDTPVSKAKKAIADYKKALGTPAELAELMVFYCEQASGFASDVCLELCIKPVTHRLRR